MYKRQQLYRSLTWIIFLCPFQKQIPDFITCPFYGVLSTFCHTINFNLSEYIRVALVGYTNVGKTTLMNLFSKSDNLAENKLFATLDTTIRSVSLDKIHTILLSDTVGFVRKLPHHLVASFRSTLKEIVESNLILIVLDSSSDYLIFLL